MKKIFAFVMLMASVVAMTCCTADNPYEEYYNNWNNNGNMSNSGTGNSATTGELATFGWQHHRQWWHILFQWSWHHRRHH